MGSQPFDFTDYLVKKKLADALAAPVPTNRNPVSQYEEELQNTPQIADYKPSGFRNVMSRIAALGAGLAQGSEYNIGNPQDVYYNDAYAPYRRAVSAHQQRMSSLKQAADMRMQQDYRESQEQHLQEQSKAETSRAKAEEARANTEAEKAKNVLTFDQRKELVDLKGRLNAAGKGSPYSIELNDGTKTVGKWDGEHFIDSGTGLAIDPSAVDISKITKIGNVVKPPGSLDSALLSAAIGENQNQPLNTDQVLGLQHKKSLAVQPPLAQDLRAAGIARDYSTIATQQDSSLDRGIKTFGDTYQKGYDNSSARLDKLNEALLDLNHDPAGAVGKAAGVIKFLTATTSGKDSGVRITMPELTRIIHARGWSGSAEAFVNKISGKGDLSTSQIRQMSYILNDIKGKVQQKMSIYHTALGKIRGAKSRDEMISADQEASDALLKIESGQSKSTVDSLINKYGGK